MGSIRLYTGDDGTSHIEEINPTEHPNWNTLHGAKGIMFRSQEPGYFSDWHIAPRRQYLITLSGEAEIGLKDGTVYRLGPGDVNLAEDLTGAGHTTRIVGNVPRVTAIVHLAD
ncbi:MAG: hypothetical protein HQ475_01295 [SAR202 cluster bacterium]|nr:hypothetical protein [SAR202 cluster bacterium]